jgi:hypothetical protein
LSTSAAVEAASTATPEALAATVKAASTAALEALSATATVRASATAAMLAESHHWGENRQQSCQGQHW